jgi:hypothetical protein
LKYDLGLRCLRVEKIKKLSIIAIACILLSLAISTVATATNPWDLGDTTTDEEAAVLFGLGLTVCLILVIIPLIIAIIACIWIYKDAEKRGKSGALWVILLIVCSLLFSFIGFIVIIIIWLAIRPPIGGAPQQQTGPSGGRMCPNCGRPIPMDAQVCPYCGKDFRQ